MQQRKTSYPLAALHFLIYHPRRTMRRLSQDRGPPSHSSRSVSGMPRRVRGEFSREIRHSEQTPENMPIWHRGVAPSLPFVYPIFGVALAPYMPAPTTVRGLEDMISSLLNQHILSYESSRGFVIPSFAVYDGSSYPYDHMLHFNQVMILNAGDDRQLCKVFPTSLKGPALTWFHRLPRRFMNSFSELWAAFVSQYLCYVR